MRKLAAIMFTDIVGYSALMSRDEKLAMGILEKNRNLHKETIAKFNGQYIKEVGDGTLAIFHSSFDAVNCALEIQKACCTEHSLKVRVGIHTGDIIESEGDVFGDGVNVASRIEAAGEPGGIYISEKAYDDIKNKADIRAEFYGEKKLKNIPDPVRIYSVLAGDYNTIAEKQQPTVDIQPLQQKAGIITSRQFFSRKLNRDIAAVIVLAVIITGGYFLINKKHGILRSSSGTAKLAQKGSLRTWTNSIAVLPFTDLSPEKDQEYFCDGMAEELINVLTYIPELKVVARTSAFSFKGKDIDIREIGDKLKVKTILEGSVRKSGNQLRISAQLIDVNHGYHLWSQTYDRELKDVFAIQDEIASAIVAALKTRLVPEDMRQTENNQTKNTEAYEFYLKGRFFCNKRSEEGLKKSIEYFKKAIAADPNYALAYTSLADAYSIQTYWGWNQMPDGYEKAKESVLRALELDKNLAEAYATLGNILCYLDWKWEESRKMLKMAIQLNPNYATAHKYYAELLNILGENDEARDEINLAIELDPVFFIYHNLSSMFYLDAGMYNESLEATNRMQELNPDFIAAYLRFFWIYYYLGDDSRAIEALQKYMTGDISTINYVNTVWDVYNKSGMKGVLKLLIELWQTEDSPPLLRIAVCYSVLEEKECALTWLEKAMEDRIPNIPSIMSNPAFAILHDESRFLAMIGKMGLAPYFKQASN